MLDKKEAKTCIVRLYCNNCNHEMEHDGNVLCSYPPQFSYICPNCGCEITANELYPKVEYQEIKNNEEDNVQ